MTTIAPYSIIVPARLASTRLPRKALADVAGQALVVRVAQAAARTTASRVVVATDADEIAAATRAAGFETVLTDPDHQSGTDRLAEAAASLGLPDDHIVVNLQGDEPLMPASICEQVAMALSQNADWSMSTAAHAIESAKEFENPNVVKVVCAANGQALYFSRAPIPFARSGQAGWAEPGQAILTPLRHIGIYGYRVSFLRQFPNLTRSPLEAVESLEQLRALWHGFRIGVVTVLESPGPGVDTAQDLEQVRELFRAQGI